MPKGYTSDKSIMRRELLRRRASLADDEREKAQTAADARVINELKGKRVMIYVSIGSEISTRALFDKLIASGAEVYAPYTADGMITPRRLIEWGTPDNIGNLSAERYGEAADELDCALVPLLGYNSDGYRIGYGAGCYDRFLAGRDILKIGYAFDFQQCEFEPDVFDVPLDICITDKKVIYFNNARNIG